MRIKLNFADIHSYLESSLSKSWFLLDPDSVKTVADLAKELTHRFQLKCNSDSLLLTLDDCLLPDWESTWILRDDDTVRCVCYLRNIILCCISTVGASSCLYAHICIHNIINGRRRLIV